MAEVCSLCVKLAVSAQSFPDFKVLDYDSEHEQNLSPDNPTLLSEDFTRFFHSSLRFFPSKSP